MHRIKPDCEILYIMCILLSSLAVCNMWIR
jgi:hypothetical protein